MTTKAIAILLHDFNAGGTEATAFRLAAEWIALGHRVTIVAGAARGRCATGVPAGGDGCACCRPKCRAAPLRGYGWARRWRRCCARVAPDVAYLTGNFHFWLAPALRRALPDLPIVAKISNPLLPDLPRAVSPVTRAVLRRLTDPIDVLVAMSPELAERDRVLLPGRPIRIAPEPNLATGHMPLPRDAPPPVPHILAIGRMERQKNLALALRAFADLHRERVARLTILGDGPERPRLEALARRLGIADAVAMPGFAPDIAPDLARASLLLLTSRYEGFPAVPVEALAADVPVVATDCSPVLRGLLPTPLHGRVSARATPAALATAMRDTLAQPFTSCGVRPHIVAGYTAAAAARRYLEIFDDAIALHPDTAPCVAR
ncbi:glycosyltransferase [Sphingomonas adhaesiva]|uniref:glycosyltransferase n=1 Tax=Sphingomonas adhaesiva TaxID=28212 RepID=UPI002FFAFFD2